MHSLPFFPSVSDSPLYTPTLFHMQTCPLPSVHLPALGIRVTSIETRVNYLSG